ASSSTTTIGGRGSIVSLPAIRATPRRLRLTLPRAGAAVQRPASRLFRSPASQGEEPSRGATHVRARRDQDQTFEMSRVRLRKTAKKSSIKSPTNVRHGRCLDRIDFGEADNYKFSVCSQLRVVT